MPSCTAVGGDLFLILGNASQAETALGKALTVARARMPGYGSCALRRVWAGCGGNSAGTLRPETCLNLYTAGSSRASTPRTYGTQEHC